MNIRYFLFLLCWLPSSLLWSQKEGIQWYFGEEAGLYFDGDTAYALSWGKLISAEGSSAICDGRGNLLFYTAGAIVFNREHNRMPNGVGLAGNTTTTQSNMVLPWPENPGKYFIITAGGVAVEGGNFGAGMQYSVVDMSQDSGRGDVVLRNQRLFSPAAEKMAAIPHTNGCDYWIIGHEYGSNAFRTYLLNKDGIDPNPVISSVGSPHQGTFPGPLNTPQEYNALGWLSVSPDGRRLATTIFFDGIIELFDFDPGTGQISNPLKLNFKDRIYGLAFSPDGQLLYASRRVFAGEIFQLNLNAGSPGAIIGSAQTVGTYADEGPGAIQRGPDGKLYIARYFQEYLSVIRQPNRLGAACEFVRDGVYLKRRLSNRGLPVMANNFLQVPPFNTYKSCVEAPLFFNFDNPERMDSVFWNFGDPATGADNFSRIFTPKHTFSMPGDFTVTLIRYFKNGKVDTASQVVTVGQKPVIQLGRDTILCQGDTLRYDVSTPGKGVSYRWQDGSTDSVYTIRTEGIYQVSVSNSCGISSATKVVAYAAPPQVNLGPGFGLCPDSVQAIGIAEQRLTAYRWQDGSTGPAYLVTQPGAYTLTATNACGSESQTVQVFEANCDCELFVSNVFTPNEDGINDVFLPDYPCTVTYFRMQIFDRWGRQVFASDSPTGSWDGNCAWGECPAGTYYYVLEFEGDPRVDAQRELHKGAITLMR